MMADQDSPRMRVKVMKVRTEKYQNGAITLSRNNLPSVHISVTHVGSVMVHGHTGISEHVVQNFRSLGDDLPEVLNLESNHTTSAVLPRKSHKDVKDLNQPDVKSLLCELVKLSQDQTGLGKS